MKLDLVEIARVRVIRSIDIRAMRLIVYTCAPRRRYRSGTVTDAERRRMATRPIRFFHRGRVVEVERRRTDPHACSTGCARTRAAPAPRKAATKATAAPAPWSSASWPSAGARRGARQLVGGLSPATVNACIQFLPTLDGKALFTVEDLKPRHAGGDAAPGAAGDGRVPRLAVRLLHPRLRDVAVADLRAPPRGRHARRRASSWPTSCRATCAAAPATGRSSMPGSACSSCRPRGSTPRRSPAALRSAARRRAASPTPTPLGARPSTRRARWTHSPRCARREPGRAAARRLDRHRPVGQQAVPRPGRHPLRRRGRRAEAHRRAPTARCTSAPAPRSKTPGARWPRAGPTLDRRLAALRRRRRCATPARWAATSPTARRSATAPPVLMALDAQHRAAPRRSACAAMPLRGLLPRLHEEPARAGRVRAGDRGAAAARRRSRCAPTRSPSASTATSRRCAPAWRSSSTATW